MSNFEIRNQMKLKRQSLNRCDVSMFSNKIFDNVLSLNLNSFQTVFLYKDFKNEVATNRLISHFLSQNKTVLFPVIKGDEMVAVKPLSSDYSLSKFGTSEPENYEIVDKIDVCFLPLLACDKQKNRLGFGKGYYDKFLSTHPCVKIGLCYDFQATRGIETHSHDIPLDYIVTESQIF
jgi:5-formyltetrahydrofolate cyclo-ligase